MPTQSIELARCGELVIHKKTGISRAEFEAEHVQKMQPVVLTDASAAWPARQSFTPDYFRKHFGAVEVPVNDRPMRLDACLDLLEASSKERPGPYPCHYPMEQFFAAALPEISPRPAVSLPDRTQSRLLPGRLLGGAYTLEVFFGGPGGEFPYLHYDYMGLHAFINQLYGRKEFTAIPPGQTEYVYPNPEDPWRSLIENHHQPDLEKYPLFAKASKLTFTIGPGETLFIPNGWWHTARSLDVTISVAFDRLDRSNWQRFRKEVQFKFRNAGKAKLLLADAYLVALNGLLSTTEAMGVA